VIGHRRDRIVIAVIAAIAAIGDRVIGNPTPSPNSVRLL
jgi:hypothetical protein